MDKLTDENEKSGESEENEKLELGKVESIDSQVFESKNGKVNIDRFIKKEVNDLAIITSIVLGIIIVVRVSPKVLVIGIIVSLVSLFFLKIIKIIINKLHI